MLVDRQARSLVEAGRRELWGRERERGRSERVREREREGER